MSILKYITGTWGALGLMALPACGLWPEASPSAAAVQRFVIGAPGEFRLPDDGWFPPEPEPEQESERPRVRPLPTPVPAPTPSPTLSGGGAVTVSAGSSGGGGSGGGGGVSMRPAVVEQALPGLQLGVEVAPGGFVDPAASVSLEVGP